MTELQAALCAEFEALDQARQMDVLQNDGVYIGKLKSDGHRLLYQYGTIYVEVVYTVHRREIQQIHCHTDTSVLDDYFSANGDEKSQFP